MSVRKDGSFRYDGHWRRVRQAVSSVTATSARFGVRDASGGPTRSITSSRPAPEGSSTTRGTAVRSAGPVIGRGRTASGSEASRRAGIGE
jgi:hypothetical protein